MLDPRGHVTSWNPGARRFKGYEADEIIGRHFSTFYTDAERAQNVPALALQEAERTGRFEREGCASARTAAGLGPCGHRRYPLARG